MSFPLFRRLGIYGNRENFPIIFIRMLALIIFHDNTEPPSAYLCLSIEFPDSCIIDRSAWNNARSSASSRSTLKHRRNDGWLINVYQRVQVCPVDRSIRLLMTEGIANKYCTRIIRVRGEQCSSEQLATCDATYSLSNWYGNR